jgi:hypothetical protein
MKKTPPRGFRPGQSAASTAKEMREGAVIGRLRAVSSLWDFRFQSGGSGGSGVLLMHTRSVELAPPRRTQVGLEVRLVD